MGKLTVSMAILSLGHFSQPPNRGIPAVPAVPAPGSAALKGMRRLAHRVERSCAQNLQEPLGRDLEILIFEQDKKESVMDQS